MKKMRLASCCSVITGTTPKTSNSEYYASEDIPFYKPGDLQEGIPRDLIKSDSWLSFSAREAARLVPTGSILVTCIGIIGKVGITTYEESAFNQQINAVVPESYLDSKYLAHQLAYRMKIHGNFSNKAVVPIVNKKAFSSIEVLAPPLSEQKEVASLFEQIAALQKKQNSSLKKLDELVKSRFNFREVAA